jgi:shikimate kinase
VILKLVRTPGVYLIGFMGSGKSTVGKSLARKLGWDFYDLDDDIEQHAGKTIAEIFATDGEEAFRAMEKQALEERVKLVQSGHAMVLALGGGACLGEGCLQRLTRNGVTVYLECDLETLATRVAKFSHRPLAADPEAFRKRFEERKPIYETAEFRVDGSTGSEEQIAETILGLGVF